MIQENKYFPLISIHLMLKFEKFCFENFSSFYVGSGFGLLALRGGFIPWIWVSTLEHSPGEREGLAAE